MNMQQRQQKSITSQPQMNKYLPTASSLIQAFMRSKTVTNSRQALQTINNYSRSLAKKTQLFAKTLSKIISKKQFKNKKSIFSILLQLRISDILLKKQKVIQLKLKSKQQSLGLFSTVVLRNMRQKVSQTFHELKSKTLLKSKRMTFKIFSLVSCVKTIERRKLRDGVKLIKLQSFCRLVKYKRCFLLERFYATKRGELLSTAFVSLRGNARSSDNAQSRINVLSPSQKHSHLTHTPQQQSTQLKQLQQQKQSLQSQLKSAKSQTQQNFKSKQSQLSKLQQEYESIRFSFELMGQDNQQINETIVEQQRLNENRRQGSDIVKPVTLVERKFGEGEIWKSVFDNLMYYLVGVKRKQSQGEQVEFSAEAMLERLTEPLVDLSPSVSQEELLEENTILKELLQTYLTTFNKNLKQIQGQKERQISLSPQLLNKQRKFLLYSLQRLTRWGTTDEQGLQEMKVALQKLKNKQKCIESAQ